VVEGELDLYYVDALNYIQMHVVDGAHRYTTDPESVELLDHSDLTLEELAARGQFFDLDDARSQGLVPASRVRQGGTWADLFAELDKVVEPLLAGGVRRRTTGSRGSTEIP
jgi:hypothetical protein